LHGLYVGQRPTCSKPLPGQPLGGRR
jgi:hypothetical protein